MRRIKIIAALVPVLVVSGIGMGFAASALAGSRAISFEATLSGYSEVPAISTTATGTFEATADPATMTIDYTLTYSGASSTISAAHIHFAQVGVNGGIVAFLCGGGGKPPCPATSGTVSGTIVASDILAVPGQGISAGELQEVGQAMVRGVTYANVHSATFGGGEFRGQIVRTG